MKGRKVQKESLKNPRHERGLIHLCQRRVRIAQEEVNRLQEFQRHFEFEFAEKLTTIVDQYQKYLNVIFLPSRSPMDEDAA
jgi:hypothetical protein